MAINDITVNNIMMARKVAESGETMNGKLDTHRKRYEKKHLRCGTNFLLPPLRYNTPNQIAM